MNITSCATPHAWQRTLRWMLGAVLAFGLISVGVQRAQAAPRGNDGWHADHRMTGEPRRDARRREWNERRWHGDRPGYSYRPQYQGPYAYAAPVYVPPPVYYQPRQSPGISLFFPLDLR